ncbi:hypothetical protein BD289DRAFT_496919 [Coniella lustricola]|uniref:ZZ-type domain-containing protein n=1 Tax=Coniella lustricola TaxID=2025994 RepID=A0A2T3ACK3_9PEZI|nr:hypothetical protein BD289DRAFT_496919 [Coniella lustricola]
MASSSPATPDTLVTLKVNFQGSTRRFKLPLRDLGVNVFEDKIRAFLYISPEANATFERYSDSASSYVVLDPSNNSVWKQLYRAAKAKQKLKLRVILQDSEDDDDDSDVGPKPVSVEDEPEEESQHFSQSKPEAPLSMKLADLQSKLANTMMQDTWQDTAEPFTQKMAMLQSILQSRPEQLDEAAKTTETDSVDKQLCASVDHLSLNADKPSPNTSTMCVAPKAANFAVCCNICERTIPDAHFHCSTCDEGDFDLCPECVELGHTCYNSEHWLLKRFVRGDFILVSTTEKVAPKSSTKSDSAPSVTPIPATAPVSQPLLPLTPCIPSVSLYRQPLRTCNSCVQELPDKEFLHCTTCADFDLCKACFRADAHGHHPQHGFVPAVKGTPLTSDIEKRLAPGRDQRHHAICDGCDNFIFGVRHKCLDCPDWDFCQACVVNAGIIHAGHRFVPIYDQIADARSLPASRPCHYGICCDGPLCKGLRKAYIVGERYKCTVCHDTDFCASCEAAPSNTHNRTHPLIKFKTPVRRVEITTLGEDGNGVRLPPLGDVRSRKPVGGRADVCSAYRNTATSPRTVVDTKHEPEVQPEVKSEAVKAEVKFEPPSTTTSPEVSADKLIAVFERDTIADGTAMVPDQNFEQTWVLRNGGDVAWPAGCSVKCVGGDYMGHVDPRRPVDHQVLASAYETSVATDAVAPGQSVSFSVTLRSPTREGRAISWWRLTTKDGQKFGHRLWCDVVVGKAKATECAPEAPMAIATPIEQQSEKSAASSQMIFPKLEKESPESSTHEAAEPEVAKSTENEADDFEDCGEGEDWAEETDEGFMTDEEYDILDASDEEFTGEQHK